MSTETPLSEAVEAAKQLAARFPVVGGFKRWEILTDDFTGFNTRGTREFLVIYLTPEERGWFQTRTLECLLGIEMYSQGDPVAVNVDYLASYLRHSLALMEGVLNQILAREQAHNEKIAACLQDEESVEIIRLLSEVAEQFPHIPGFKRWDIKGYISHSRFQREDTEVSFRIHFTPEEIERMGTTPITSQARHRRLISFPVKKQYQIGGVVCPTLSIFREGKTPNEIVDGFVRFAKQHIMILNAEQSP